MTLFLVSVNRMCMGDAPKHMEQAKYYEKTASEYLGNGEKEKAAIDYEKAAVDYRAAADHYQISGEDNVDECKEAAAKSSKAAADAYKQVGDEYKSEYEKKAAADSLVFAKSQEIKNVEIEKTSTDFTVTLPLLNLN